MQYTELLRVLIIISLHNAHSAKEETLMFEHNSIIIDPEKGNEFEEFIHKNAKNTEFWDAVKMKASTPIDKDEIDKLFED